MKNLSLTLLVVLTAFIASIAQPAKIEVKKAAEKWQLYKNGEPFFIKGLGGIVQLEKAKNIGANSIRTFSVHRFQQVLDAAQTQGLSVTLTFNLPTDNKAWPDFAYGYEESRQWQIYHFKTAVDQYKNSPALLMYCLGNELEHTTENLQKMFETIQELAKYIHTNDPNHPTSLMIDGYNEGLIDQLIKNVPDLDILGINVKNNGVEIAKQMQNSPWKKAYLIGEYSTADTNFSSRTKWGAPIEKTSTQQAKDFKQDYEALMNGNNACIGTYSYYWGQQFDITQTWYSMLDTSGNMTARANVLHYLWKGNWPVNKAPEIESFTLNQKPFNSTDCYLVFGQSVDIFTKVTDAEGDYLEYTFEIRKEKNGELMEGLINPSKDGKAKLQAPKEEGAYRLYVYITDNSGNLASASMPFYSQEQNPNTTQVRTVSPKKTKMEADY